MKNDLHRISKNGSSYLGIDSYGFLNVKGSNLNGTLGFSKDIKVLTDWTRLNIKVKDYFSVNNFTIVHTLDNKFFFCGEYFTIQDYKRYQFGFKRFKTTVKNMKEFMNKDLIVLKIRGIKFILKIKGDKIG